MISPHELSKALGFLQRQMGDDELRTVLERLECAGDGTIQVGLHLAETRQRNSFHPIHVFVSVGSIFLAFCTAGGCTDAVSATGYT